MNLLDLIKIEDAEWLTLDKISKKISSGGTPKTGTKEFYDNGNIPWLRTQEVNFGEIWDTGVKITDEAVKNSSAKWIPENCVIVAMYGATVGKIGINKIPLTTNQACCNIELDETKANYRYVFHYLMSQYNYIRSLGTGSQTNINAQIVKSLEIPIPSLEIQQKVVEILDKFTDYVTELTAELTLRQKQYAYYRDLLLTFPSQGNSSESLGVEWRSLGGICEIKRGKRLVKKELEEVGKYPVYQNSMTPLGYYHQFNFDGDNTFIICAGAAGEIGYMSENFWAADDVSVLTVPSNLMSRYLYHFLLTKQNSIKSKVRRASVPRLSKISFENIKIPVPSLSEQKHIVEILDKFDKLTSDLTEGLPREIELRQKQYEYWREQLLSFKKE